MYDFLHAPPPTFHTIMNDHSTISSNLTMNTNMDIVESNISGLENSVNHMAHMLKTFMHGLRQERRQDNNSAPS